MEEEDKLGRGLGHTAGVGSPKVSTKAASEVNLEDFTGRCATCRQLTGRSAAWGTCSCNCVAATTSKEM
eukprot:3399657-Pleurochrysis_carterae.AAC.1